MVMVIHLSVHNNIFLLVYWRMQCRLLTGTVIYDLLAIVTYQKMLVKIETNILSPVRSVKV